MKRDNFYKQSVSPKDGLNELSEEFFWPTDTEFELIYNVIMSKEYSDYRYDLHGVEGVAKELLHFENEDRYSWLAINLKKEKPDYEEPLTFQVVLKILQDFETKVVKNWLNKQI